MMPTAAHLDVLAKIYRVTADKVDDGTSVKDHIDHCEYMVSYDEKYSSNTANPPDKRARVAARLADRKTWLAELKAI